ncbi:MAG: HEAT repeat domain-containing protein [Mastigocoleus sp.]
MNDTNVEVPSQAVQSLSNLKAVDSLITALADIDEFVRERAANCLGRLENSKAVQPLSQLLKDSSFFVREAARIALKQL